MSHALRLLAAVPAIAIMVLATGLWRTPDPSPPQLGDRELYEPLLIRVEYARPAERFRWEAETLGLMLALLEGGLSSIEGVTARVEGVPIAPGMEAPIAPSGYWDADLRLLGDGDSLRAELMVCDPRSACTPLVAEGTTSGIDEVARSLVERVTVLLNRPTRSGPEWTRRQSADPYAQLIGGRSAAVWYGLHPPPPEGTIGDVRLDPVARALYLDPDMPIARWIAARRWLAMGDMERAEAAMRAGAEKMPNSLLEVGHAAILLESGAAEASLERWQALRTSKPQDPRVELGEINALVGAGRVEEARQRLDALPMRIQDTARALGLRADLEEAAGRPPSPDGLLARWQARAPRDPVPVRRRIQALVNLGRFEDALALTSELQARGAEDEAQALHVALAAELGQWEEVVQTAGVSDPDLATSIQQILGKDDGPVSPGADPQMQQAVSLARAERLLADGQIDEALAAVDRLLKSHPHSLGALILRVEILEHTTDARALEAAQCALHHVHPGALAPPTSAATQALARRCDP